MHNYSIDIKGMHCSGCKNLLAMLFEEQGFTEIDVSLENNKAIFSSKENIDIVRELLDSAFKEAGDYSYYDLVTR